MSKNNYKHILLAIDLHPHCDQATAVKAVELSKETGAKLTIVHAIEHINAYGIAQAYPTVLDLEQEMIKQAKEELHRLCSRVGIAPGDAIIEIGSPKMVILDVAQRLDCDLVIVGSHGRHGINVLMGSTANAVLHHAHCDVLAVRLK